MGFIVRSEVGQLRQVIVHRPGLELSRLTPHNVGELLFDDVMWAKKAREEHDAFAGRCATRACGCITSASFSPRPWNCLRARRHGRADHPDGG
jgi:hypothetical protein